MDAEATELVGALPPVHTIVSGILVVPFVACSESLPAFAVSEQRSSEVFTFTVARSRGGRGAAGAAVARGGQRLDGSRTSSDGDTIWGATGWMLHALLEGSCGRRRHG